MAACKDCGREFEARDSMEQHYAAKHTKQKPAPAVTKKPKNKLILALAAVAIVSVIGYFAFFNSSGEKPLITAEAGSDYSVNLDEVPNHPIHWHPTLTIIINGVQQQIPRNLGVSGSIEYPVHTHEDVPVLHYELDKPTAETVTLGYFFNTVWRRQFNNNCIFDYCNGPDGNLTMTVNGKPNPQFDKYIPKDGDDIRILFE